MTDNNIVSVAAGAKVKTRIISSSPVSDVFGDTHLQPHLEAILASGDIIL